MIPSIEDVLQMLLDGNIDKQQALFYIDQHMENVANGAADLRDHFAGLSMQGFIAARGPKIGEESIISEWSYQVADAMLKARKA